MPMFKSPALAVLGFSLVLAGQSAHGEEAGMGAWTKKAPMRFARSEFQAAAVNGTIYVIGGSRTDMKDGKPFDSYTNGDVDEYDPSTNTWRTRTPMPEGS